MINHNMIMDFLKEKGLHAPILTVSFQRKFNIRYREAAEIVDELEENGYISEYFPNKKVRYVLKFK